MKETIPVELSIREALTLIEKRPDYKVLFVEDADQKLVGSITDGDVRRGLIAGVNLDDSVSHIMRKDFRHLKQGEYGIQDLDVLREKQISVFPLIDSDGRIVRIINLNKQISLLPLQAIIMAGGRGQRLMPLTKNIPKPLLEVGGTPILERNVDRLIRFGISNIHISVNHLSELIVDFFTTTEKDANIQFIYEDTPLGTIGAAGLVGKFTHDHVLVMNSDLLTNINFEEMYRTAIEENADMVIAGIPYPVNIPYAVMETSSDQVTNLVEKPTYEYLCNAGIYIIRKEALAYIPKGEPFNATDLIELLLKESKQVITYSCREYWLDIGQHKDYERAQRDIEHIKF